MLLGTGYSTIEEGQRLGTVHIMEGTCYRLGFFVRNIYIYMYTRTHTCTNTCTFPCACTCVSSFLLCGAVSCRVPRVVGWLGVVWCCRHVVVVVVFVRVSWSLSLRRHRK